MAASQYGHVEVVDKLLQHGATVDLLDKVSNVSMKKHVYSILAQHWHRLLSLLGYLRINLHVSLPISRLVYS